MAQDTINFIKQKLKTFDPTIDVSDSSAMIDLLVNPLSTILEPFDINLKNAFLQLSLQNIDQISDTMMDARAADFGITRITGAKATGTVRIYFASPINVTIPKNSTFTTKDGRQFKNSTEYTFSANTLRSNIERYPLYGTGNITVTAVKEGSTNEAFIGEISAVAGLNVSYRLVTNITPILGGVERETNAALKQRILEAFTSLTLNSADSISKVLKTSYPTLLDVIVKAIGDDEMTRDIYYSGIGVGTYFLSDFFGKISGFNDYPYNRSRAFYGYFADYSIASGVTLADLPVPGAFTYEIQDYSNLFKYDSNRMTVSVGNILDTTLNSSNSISTWSKSDGQLGTDTLFIPKEIEFDTTKTMVRLGKTGDSSTYYHLKNDDVDKWLKLFKDACYAQPAHQGALD